MIKLEREESDATQFLGSVESIINKFVLSELPSHLYVIKIKNWFGQRWLTFSGKVMGVMGVWKSQLTLPPFTPSRVLSEHYYSLSSGVYTLVPNAKKLHVKQSTSQNLVRRAALVVPGSILIWYSSNSELQGRGAIMVYSLAGMEPWPWYIEFKRSDKWSVVRFRNVSLQELTAFGMKPYV
jgi:hypothetical protein